MGEISIAYCDDDGVFRSRMRRAVEEVLARSGTAAAGVEASGPAELAAAAGHLSFDLIFLDIDMPGMDGIRFGEELRARGCRSDIIYVSNMEDKVYEIFRVHPWSFIRKSRFFEELEGVLGEYLKSRRDRTEALLLQDTEGGVLSLEPESILYVEAAGKSQKLFTGPGQSVTARCALGELEERLAPYGFIRIHKGFLVNYRAIRKITSRGVLLDTGGELPVGRDRLGPARERYLALMKWKGLARDSEA